MCKTGVEMNKGRDGFQDDAAVVTPSRAKIVAA
jgi:hypothetical protein